MRSVSILGVSGADWAPMWIYSCITWNFAIIPWKFVTHDFWGYYDHSFSSCLFVCWCASQKWWWSSLRDPVTGTFSVDVINMLLQLEWRSHCSLYHWYQMVGCSQVGVAILKWYISRSRGNIECLDHSPLITVLHDNSAVQFSLSSE